jgi:hypothetical protein
LEEEELLSAGVSLPPRGRRASDPVLSDVDWLGMLADALFSPPDEGRITRKLADMLNVSEEWKFWQNCSILALII